MLGAQKNLKPASRAVSPLANSMGKLDLGNQRASEQIRPATSLANKELRAHTEIAVTGNNAAFDMTLGSESIGIMENTLGQQRNAMGDQVVNQ